MEQVSFLARSRRPGTCTGGGRGRWSSGCSWAGSSTRTRWRPTPTPSTARLMSEVALAEVGDRTNWKYSWWTEHHFLWEYSHISANESIMPFVAARTNQMHIGSGIINITPPVNHPARVAERVAMLDHLSEGRFEFGTGRGSSTTEQAGFGINDPELTKDMYDEAIGEFKKMWAPGTYSVRRHVLLDARAQRPAEAVREAAPADVGRRGQPGHVREGRQDGPRRPLLHRWLAGEDGAARRDLQERDRRGRAGRRVRQRQRRDHHELHVPRGPRRGDRLGDDVRATATSRRCCSSTSTRSRSRRSCRTGRPRSPTRPGSR